MSIRVGIIFISKIYTEITCILHLFFKINVLFAICKLVLTFKLMKWYLLNKYVHKNLSYFDESVKFCLSIHTVHGLWMVCKKKAI